MCPRTSIPSTPRWLPLKATELCPTCGRSARSPKIKVSALNALRAGLLACRKDGSPDWFTRLKSEQRLADTYGWRQVRRRGRPRGSTVANGAKRPGEKGRTVAAPAWLAPPPTPPAAEPPLALPG